jgi:predicted Rossmann fold nucleotide-binding protein DprA/Smf involved in DNA uptake
MVGPSPIHIDEVVTETGLPPSIVSSTLMTLEIRGLIRQLAGQRYVRG